MLAEISIQPQVGRDIRRELTQALEEIEAAGLSHEVEPFGTVIDGDLEQILSAVRRVHARLAAEGVERFELHLRLRQEPGEMSIEGETAGFRERPDRDRLPQPMPGLEP
jgi:uncharacterized protein YqgV (UPF0045/DUF77 family)